MIHHHHHQQQKQTREKKQSPETENEIRNEEMKNSMDSSLENGT